MKQAFCLRFFWCVYLTFLAVQSQGQSVFPGLSPLTPTYSHNFSAEHRLPQTCASDVIMDRRGRLWVSTCPVMAGINSVRLFQFDGYGFNPINLVNDSMPDRTVAIFKQISAGGELLGWFQSEAINALFFFNPDQQTSRVVPFTREEGFIKDMALESDGQVLVLLSKQDSLMLFRLDKLLHKERLLAWINPAPVPALPDYAKTVAALFVSGDEVLIATNAALGIFQVQLRERRCQPYPITNYIPAPSGILSGNNLISDEFSIRFIPTSQGEMICLLPGTQNNIFIRSSAGKPFEPMPGLPAAYSVSRIEKDSAQNILFLLRDAQGHYAGLLRDRQGRTYDYSAFVKGHTDIYNVHSLHFLQSAFICSDDGLSYKSVRKENAVACVLPGYSLRGMFETKPGQFYITSENKTSISYTAASGKIEILATDAPWLKAFDPGQIKKLDVAADGSLWGNRGGFIVRYNPLTETHRDYVRFPSLWYQALLSDGRIAVLTQDQGLFFYDPVSGQTVPLKNGERLKEVKGLVHEMKQTRDGFLWLLTTNGLWQIDLKHGVQKRLGFEPPFRDFRFLCMAEANDGKLWLGTFLGGVHIYDPKTGAVQVVDQSKGLPNNTVASITRDAAGDFWAATYGGLARLSTEGVVMTTFLQEEGLCELEFNRYAALLTQDKALFLGTINGLHIIRPQLLEEQRKTASTPQIYLTSLSMVDATTGVERSYQSAFENLPELVLPPDRRHLRVRFALSSYVQSERNQFSYMLEGVDKSWTFIGPQHELSFNDLPAGRYTLLIKGCDLQGNWTPTPVRVSIYAREFFYKQPWFYALCLLPFIAFAWVWLKRLRSEKKRLEKEVKRRTGQIQKDKELIEQQAQELIQLDEVKSRFFTNISHELRTPITLITAPLEKLLQDNHSGNGKGNQEEALRRVLYNGRKLATLVEELLELSRLEAGKSELQETPTAFYPYCRQIFSAFESQAQIKRIRYALDYAVNENWRLLLDKRRLEKIINNLISNALKFTPPDGEVRVSVAQESKGDHKNAQVSIRVEDSGRGIPPEDLPHLFERYFQTKRSDLSREGGTGIGLALAKELATLMKGDLQVESEWGKGSAFTLSIPLKILADTAAIPAPMTEIAPELLVEMKSAASLLVKKNGHSPRQTHILVVEDNPDMQALLHSLLADEYALSIANDGQEAWDMLEAEDEHLQNLSLILSDVMMPRMDGYELLEKIKSHPRWQQVPVILLTARAEAEDKLQALQLGVDDYLVKPFSPPELAARLSNLIGNYWRRQSFAVKAVPDIAFEAVDSQGDVWLKSIETAAKTALDKGLPLQVGLLADAGAVSVRQLLREIKRLTGLTPKEYILEVRLQKARHLLQHRSHATLAEVAYAVGFDTPGYFTKVFETHFGKHPSAYL